MVNIVRRNDPFESLLRGFFVRPVGVDNTYADEPEIASLRVEVRENAEAYLVRAELPGINKEDINVRIEGNQLSISAERRQEKTVKEGERVLRSELSYGQVARSFQLGQDVDETRAEAKYNDGVLELSLPKKAGNAARRLSIQ